MSDGIIEHDSADTQAEAARLTTLADDCAAVAHSCIEASENLAADQASWADEWKPEGSHKDVTAKLSEALTTLATQASEMAESIRAESATLEQRVVDAEAVEEKNAQAFEDIDTTVGV